MTYFQNHESAVALNSIQETMVVDRQARAAAVDGDVFTDQLGPGKSLLSFASSLPRTEQVVIEAALNILSRRLRKPGEYLANPLSVRNYLRLQLAGELREVFGVLYLDAQMAAIAFDIPFAGTVSQTSVHPREIVRRAIDLNASTVIFSHNHPSGVPVFSAADERLTQTLKAALDLIDVRVVDHVIVAGDSTASMAEKGLL